MTLPRSLYRNCLLLSFFPFSLPSSSVSFEAEVEAEEQPRLYDESNSLDCGAESFRLPPEVKVEASLSPLAPLPIYDLEATLHNHAAFKYQPLLQKLIPTRSTLRVEKNGVPIMPSGRVIRELLTACDSREGKGEIRVYEGCRETIKYNILVLAFVQSRHTALRNEWCGQWVR